MGNFFSKLGLVFKITACILISCIIAVAAVEIILTKSRFASERYSKKVDPEPYTFNRNKQGLRTISADINYDNSRGEYFRVICLGDSFTFGHGVRDDKTYPALLNKYLEEACRRKIQVINAGVCGADIEAEIDMYKANCANLQHDLVILLFCDADFTKIPLSKIREWRRWTADKYLRDSKTYSLLKLKILQEKTKYSMDFYNKHRESVLDKYFENISSLNEIVKSNGAVLAIVVFNNSESDNEALKKFCVNEDIQVIDIRSEYAERKAKGGIFLVYHHNEAGNAFLAESIAQALVDKNIIKKKII